MFRPQLIRTGQGVKIKRHERRTTILKRQVHKRQGPAVNSNHSSRPVAVRVPTYPVPNRWYRRLGTKGHVIGTTTRATVSVRFTTAHQPASLRHKRRIQVILRHKRHSNTRVNTKQPTLRQVRITRRRVKRSARLTHVIRPTVNHGRVHTNQRRKHTHVMFTHAGGRTCLDRSTCYDQCPPVNQRGTSELHVEAMISEHANEKTRQ